MPYNLNQNKGTELHAKTEMRSTCWLMCLATITGIILIGITFIPGSVLPHQPTNSRPLTPAQKEEILKKFQDKIATSSPITETQQNKILTDFKNKNDATSTLSNSDKSKILEQFKKNN